MAHFNVLYDPWIPVEDLNGGKTELGILPLLKEAEKYGKINCSFPLENAAITRLLAAFLMDAYQLNTIQERRILFRKGQFDSNILDQYVEKCENEGDSFDLFDPKYPFLQSAFNEQTDAEKKKSIASIVMTLPSGVNHVHFCHQWQDQHSLSYSETIRALCAYYAFCPIGGQGYSASVNGTPCVIYIPLEDNLFKQLTLCMLSRYELGNIPMDQPKITWRKKATVISGETTAEMSLLAALTWRTRRLTLIPNNDTNTVSEIYYQQGCSFKNNGLWRDPFTSYWKSKDGRWFPKMPNPGRGLWRDIGTITAASSESSTVAPLILKQAAELYNSDTSIIRSSATAVVTNQALCLEIQNDSLSIPSRYLQNVELGEWLKDDIALAEKVVQKIWSSYEKILGEETAKELERNSYIRIRNQLNNGYLEDLSKANTDSFEWQTEFRNRWVSVLRSVMKDTIHDAEQRKGSTIKNMIDMTCASDKCRKACENLFEKAGG